MTKLFHTSNHSSHPTCPTDHFDLQTNCISPSDMRGPSHMPRAFTSFAPLLLTSFLPPSLKPQAFQSSELNSRLTCSRWFFISVICCPCIFLPYILCMCFIFFCFLLLSNMNCLYALFILQSAFGE